MKSHKSLLKNNKELSSRLAEAEELLAAIKGGSVDALVTDDLKVFTLKGADYVYHVLVDMLTEGAAFLSLSGTILYCNNSLGKMLALPVDKIIGDSVFGFLSSAELARFKSFMRRRRHSVGRAEFWLKRRNRPPLPVLVSCNPLKLNRTGLCLTFTDLSEIKKAQGQLQKSHDELEQKVAARTRELTDSEKKFRLAFEKAQDAIVWADARTGIIVNCNAAAERMFERPRGELIGRHQRILHPASMRASVAENFREHASGQKRILEVPVVTKSRGVKTVLISPSLVDLGERRILQGVFHDITERKEFERALRESETKFSTMFGNTPVGISLAAIPNGEIFDVNRAWLVITGFDRKEQVLGKSTLQLGLIAEPTQQQRIIDEFRRRGRVRNAEMRIRTRTGNLRTVRVNLDTIEIGGRTFMLSTNEDITDLQLAEDELRKSHRTLRALSRSSQAIMHATDEAQYLNEVCRIVVEDCGHSMVWVGYAEDDERKTVRPVAQAGRDDGYLKSIRITWADDELGRGPTGNAIRTGKPSLCRNMFTDPRFEPWREEALKRGYACSAALPLISTGKTLGSITIYSREPDAFSEPEIALLSELAGDLAVGIMALRLRAEHAKVEDAIAANRNLLQSIIDSYTSYIYVFDREERFLIANKALAELLDSRPELMIGRARREFMSSQSAEEHEANDQRVIRTRKAVELEEHGQFKGRPFTFFTTKFPLFNEHGNIYAVAGISSDISDRKDAEDVLRQSRDTFEKLVRARTEQLVEAKIELEKARRLSDIGVLAATVAHELRNPLAAISMAAHNIKRKAGSPDLSSHLHTIDKKVAESDQIINNLLFYSRLKVPQFEKCTVFDTLDESIGLSQEKRRTGVSFVRDIDALRNVSIEADPIQIREVFNNILNNALDAVPAGEGKISISAEDGGKSVVIVITDNGHGIDKENLPRVCDPFFTTKAKGTGLGLSVCKQIIDLHEGSINIESEVGKGTAVTVSLPKERMTKSAMRKSAGTKKRGKA